MMPSTRELRLCLLGAAALAVIQWWPVVRSPSATGFGDWQMIHHNWEAAYVSLTRFGEWPLWDPFHCGGVPILGNPESQLYAPWFWLSFPFGTVLAIKLMLLGHVTLALVGMYLLARRRHGLLPPSAALAAIGWSCGGWLVWDGAGGHATFLPFAFTPWLVQLVHTPTAGNQPQGWLATAAGIAGWLVLTLYEGGTYPLPFFGLLLVFELASRMLGERRLRPSVVLAAVSGALTVLAGTIRLWPIYLALQEHPRAVPNDDALGLRDALGMLTLRSHAWQVRGHPFVWAEYGSYVGWPVLLLGAAGGLLLLGRRRWQLPVGLALFGTLMLGNIGPLAPYSLLHHLPVYDSLRVPSRFSVLTTFYLALLAAHGCDGLLRRWQRPRGVLAIGAVAALVVAVDVISASWPTITSAWREPPLSNEPPAREYHQVQRDYYRWYASYPRLNLGTTTCYVGGMNWPVSAALWLGPSRQLRSLSRGGRIHSLEQTPHRLHARIELREPGRVVLNQNFAPSFVSSHGRVVADRGRVAVDLPAGTHDLALVYQPAELVPALISSALGLGLLTWLRLRPLLARVRRRNASGAATPTPRIQHTAPSPARTTSDNPAAER
ncbi:MAG: hypothetical protein ABW321_29855 [Polyangiales bacterium]